MEANLQLAGNQAQPILSLLEDLHLSEYRPSAKQVAGGFKPILHKGDRHRRPDLASHF